MDVVDKLYELLDQSIQDYPGKICVPISGGLDSRTTAGLIGKRRKIDLSFTVYNEGGYTKHLDYAKQIAKLTNVENHVILSITEKERLQDFPKLKELVPSANPGGRTYTVLRKVNDIVPLKDYTIIVPFGLEFLTGIYINPLSLLTMRMSKFDREWEEKHYNRCERVAQNTVWSLFAKGCISPFWNEPLKTFCLSLPHRYRIHQVAYRRMLKRYFPELARVPREWMDIPMDVGELGYIWGKIKYIWMKRGLKRGKRIPFI